MTVLNNFVSESQILTIFNQVDLSWHVVHRHSKKTFPEDVVPIIVSNMDTTGTFKMAKEIAKVIEPTGPASDFIMNFTLCQQYESTVNLK